MKLLILTFLTILISSVSDAQGTLVWKYETKGGVYSSPLIYEDNIYIGSNDSTLYVLNKEDGQLKWKFKSGGMIRSKPVIISENIIFNCSDGMVYCLKKNENGKLNWVFSTGGELSYDIWDYYLSSPVLYDRSIIVGSGDSSIYSIDSENGELNWKYKTNGVVHSTPVIQDHDVFIGSFDGYFYSLNAKSGEMNWKFRTVGDANFPIGEIQKGAVIHGEAVFFGSRDYNIYALDVNNGRGLWNRKEIGSWIIATPLLYENKLYVGTSDSHTFYALNIATGDVIWSLPLNMRIYSSAITFKNMLYFGCFNGKIYQVEPDTGHYQVIFQTEESKRNYHQVYNDDDSFRSDFELYGQNTITSEKKILSLGSILATPVIDDGILYFGDANGIFYAVSMD